MITIDKPEKLNRLIDEFNAVGTEMTPANDAVRFRLALQIEEELDFHLASMKNGVLPFTKARFMYYGDD